MALDHALRDLAERDGECTLRLYTWSGSTISFGANEAAARHWDRDAIERTAVPVVRRPSGGRAVWHDADDLTYAVTGPLTLLGGLQEAYASIHRRLASALRRIEIAATIAPAPPRLPGLRRGACFDVAVGGELLVGGVKVIGSAQVASRTALLQHGAIARADRSALLAGYAHDASALAAPEHHVTPILPDANTVANAIAAEWLAAGAREIDTELTTRANAASVQYVERYRDPAWTWRR